MKEGLLELSTSARRSHAGSLNEFVTNLPKRAGATQTAQTITAFEPFMRSGIADSPFSVTYEPLQVGLAIGAISGDYLSSWETDVTELPFARAASNNASTIGMVQRLASLSSISDVLNRELLYASRFVSPEFAAKVQELLALQSDWDGDGASPVQVEELAKVVTLMRVLKQVVVEFSAPFVAPTFSGSLLLDWTSPRRTLEIQHELGYWSIVGTSTSHNDERNYYTGRSLTDVGIAPYYEWFRGDLLIWPMQ